MTASAAFLASRRMCAWDSHPVEELRQDSLTAQTKPSVRYLRSLLVISPPVSLRLSGGAVEVSLPGPFVLVYQNFQKITNLYKEVASNDVLSSGFVCVSSSF